MKPRRLHIIIVSFLLGVFVWLSVNLREQYQISFDTPLTIEGIPEGRAIRTAVPRTLQLRFRGDGWRLAALSIGAAPRLRIPLESLGSDTPILTINDVLDRIALPPGVQLIDINPDTVYLILDKKVEKRVPVTPEIAVSFRDGYGQVGPMIISPESVSVYGARSVLDRIESWRTSPARFDDLKNQLEEDVALAVSTDRMLEFSPGSVRVRVNVQPFAEKTFSGLPVEIRSLPPNRDVIFIPPKIDIVVRGGIRQLSSILPVDFQVSVEYASILSDTTGFIKPTVGSPDGVQIVALRPEKLQYIVRKRL
jgi:YbbR domain-containing protein